MFDKIHLRRGRVAPGFMRPRRASLPSLAGSPWIAAEIRDGFYMTDRTEPTESRLFQRLAGPGQPLSDEAEYRAAALRWYAFGAIARARHVVQHLIGRFATKGQLASV